MMTYPLGVSAGMSDVLSKIGDGLSNALLMAYEVWWALVLGFAISAIVQAWIPRERIEASLGGEGLGPVAKATGLGAVSSSCFYAAIAIAKSLFQKGASAALPRIPVRAGAHLPQRLGDALEGDHRRVLPRGIHRTAGQRLLQRPVHTGGARRSAHGRERDRRSDHRGAQLRLLDRQRPARGRALVGRDLVRRRDGVHLRRPDRAADHRDLPEVLRLAVRAADHGADVRDDGACGVGGRRTLQRRRADPAHAAEPQ